METVIKYIKDNRDNYLEELKEYIRIPSISTLKSNIPDIKKCSRFVADSLKKAGMKKVKIIQTSGHPLVYGEWMEAPGNPQF